MIILALILIVIAIYFREYIHLLISKIISCFSFVLFGIPIFGGGAAMLDIIGMPVFISVGFFVIGMAWLAYDIHKNE